MIINMLPKHLMKDHKMDATAKRLFLELLRSGEIQQRKGALNQDGCMCAEGVLVEAYRRAEGGEWSPVTRNGCLMQFSHKQTRFKAGLGRNGGHTHLMPGFVREWSKASSLWVLEHEGEQHVLSHLNDSLGLTFEQIADLVEAQW